MTSAELAAQLLELAKTWTVASLVLGFSSTPMFSVVYTCTFVGEEPLGKIKSFNELQAEISTLMDNDYVPIGLILWYEFAPQQAQIHTQIFDIKDSWARGILEHMVDGMRDLLGNRGIKS